jgi:hypothetical protein
MASGINTYKYTNGTPILEWDRFGLAPNGGTSAVSSATGTIRQKEKEWQQWGREMMQPYPPCPNGAENCAAGLTSLTPNETQRHADCMIKCDLIVSSQCKGLALKAKTIVGGLAIWASCNAVAHEICALSCEKEGPDLSCQSPTPVWPPKPVDWRNALKK